MDGRSIRMGLAVWPLVIVVAACVAPPPSPSPQPSAISPTATIAPTPTLTPSDSGTASSGAVETAASEPFDVLEHRTPEEAFVPIEQGQWRVVASADNLDGIDRVAVLGPMTTDVAINAACSGPGSMHVSVTSTPPSTDAPDPLATPIFLMSQDVACPDLDGVLLSLAGTAPGGSFASIDVAPSDAAAAGDPPIRYEVLVGTIVP